MKRILIWWICLTVVCGVLLTACISDGPRGGSLSVGASSEAESGTDAALEQQAREQAAALEAQYGVTDLTGWEPGRYKNSIQRSGSTATMNVVQAVEFHEDLLAFAQSFYDIYAADGMGRDMSEIAPADVAGTRGYFFTLIDLSDRTERFTALYVYNKNDQTYLATGQAETEDDFDRADFPAAIGAYSY